MRRLSLLRVAAIVILALLAFQFELGMAVNLSPNLKEEPPVTFEDLWGALSRVGAEALTHAVVGTLLTIMALASLVLSIVSGATSVMVMGVLSFVGVALAELCGVLFTLSGYKNDGYSHGMATGFLIAFSLFFVLVCVLSVRVRREPAA